LIEVSAAIIFIEKKILCLRRGYSKYDYISNKFEFPGGKLKINETPVSGLKREIKEELKIEIEIKEKFKTIIHSYPDFKIKLYSYICTTKNFSGKLYDHTEYKLLNIKDIKSLDWLEADIPLIESLMLKYNV
jgi:8-oxo-dGTP diphosphatase